MVIPLGRPVGQGTWHSDDIFFEMWLHCSRQQSENYGSAQGMFWQAHLLLGTVASWIRGEWLGVEPQVNPVQSVSWEAVCRLYPPRWFLYTLLLAVSQKQQNILATGVCSTYGKIVNVSKHHHSLGRIKHITACLHCFPEGESLLPITICLIAHIWRLFSPSTSLLPSWIRLESPNTLSALSRNTDRHVCPIPQSQNL